MNDPEKSPASGDSTDHEFVAAESAIDEAAAYANAAQAAGDAGEDAKPIERRELTLDERRELSRKIAKRQRKLGEDEFARLYPGTIVIQRQIVVADPAIASSANRFLPFVDRTLYLLNRFGNRYHTQAEVDAIRESIRALVDTYCNEAEAALSQGRELSEKAQENTMDWLTPTYTSNTLEKAFGVKARDTIKLILAMESWDKAILEFAALEFNDTASIGQIDTMRQRERRLFMGINRMCLRTIGGFSKRRDTMAQVKSEKAAPAEAATAEA